MTSSLRSNRIQNRLRILQESSISTHPWTVSMTSYLRGTVKVALLRFMLPVSPSFSLQKQIENTLLESSQHKTSEGTNYGPCIPNVLGGWFQKCFLRSGDKSRRGSKKSLCQSWQKFALVIYAVICFYAIKPYVRRVFCLFNRSIHCSWVTVSRKGNNAIHLLEFRY